jgi:hypothetical protein
MIALTCDGFHLLLVLGDNFLIMRTSFWRNVILSFV